MKRLTYPKVGGVDSIEIIEEEDQLPLKGKLGIRSTGLG